MRDAETDAEPKPALGNRLLLVVAAGLCVLGSACQLDGGPAALTAGGVSGRPAASVTKVDKAPGMQVKGLLAMADTSSTTALVTTTTAPPPTTTVPPTTAPPTTAAPTTTRPPTTTTAPPPPPPPAAPPSAVAQSRFAAPTPFLGTEEQQFLDLINQTRAGLGLGPLAAHPNLTQPARAHAQWMASTTRFEHQGLRPLLSPPWRRVAENIAYGPVNVPALHQALVDSPGHYANITNGAYTHLGVGVYIDASGRLWTSHVFGGTD